MKVPITILMADDDSDDRELTRDAFNDSHLANDLRFVEDGDELLKYLRCEGQYLNAPRPSLILLDLNMPRKDGREALKEIKSDPHLRRIPVIILTTSEAEEDIYKSYDLGANSYIRKPVTFEGLLQIVQTIERYWFKIVEQVP